MAVTPFVPFPSAMQVNMRFQYNGTNVEMVLGFDYADIGFASAAPLVYNVLDSALWGDLRLNLANTLVSTETYMIDLFSQYGGARTFGPFTNPAGAHADKGLPNNVAFVVSHRTGLRGKSYRGRTYIPGLIEGAVINNTLDAAVALSYVVAFNNMRTALFSDGINFCVLSRRINNAWRTEGQATPVEVSLTKDNRVDTQRGRLP